MRKRAGSTPVRSTSRPGRHPNIGWRQRKTELHPTRMEFCFYQPHQTGSAGTQASGGDSKRPNFIPRGWSFVFVFIHCTRPAVPAPKHRVAIAKDRTSSHEGGVLFLYRIVGQKNLAAGEVFLYHKLRNTSAAAPMLNPIPSLKRIFSPIKITEISVVRMNPPVAWPG